MNALVCIALALLATQDAKPISGKGAIKKADKIAASITTRFDPSSRSYKTIIETIEAAEIFVRPIKASVEYLGFQSTEDGSIKIEGTIRARKGNSGEYLRPEEQAELAAFDQETERAREQYRASVRTQNPHGHPVGQWVQQLRSEEARAHNRHMKDRAAERREIIEFVLRKAAPRQHDFERVHISIVINPDLAERVNTVKLATRKRVNLTLKVISFGLQQPMPEIGKPAAIGSMTCVAVDVAKNFLKK